MIRYIKLGEVASLYTIGLELTIIAVIWINVLKLMR